MIVNLYEGVAKPGGSERPKLEQQVMTESLMSPGPLPIIIIIKRSPGPQIIGATDTR